MAQFRKRPVVVEARQFTETTRQDVAAWCNGVTEQRLDLSDFRKVWVLFVDVRKGYSHAQIEEGDWVIAEPDGSGFYPCTAEDFADTYEPVTNSTATTRNH